MCGHHLPVTGGRGEGQILQRIVWKAVLLTRYESLTLTASSLHVSLLIILTSLSNSKINLEKKYICLGLETIDQSKCCWSAGWSLFSHTREVWTLFICCTITVTITHYWSAQLPLYCDVRLPLLFRLTITIVTSTSTHRYPGLMNRNPVHRWRRQNLQLLRLLTGPLNC